LPGFAAVSSGNEPGTPIAEIEHRQQGGGALVTAAFFIIARVSPVGD